MNWKEWFESTLHDGINAIFGLPSSIKEEDRYQVYKARLLSEVVAKEEITYFGDIVGKKVYEFGEKE